MNGIFKQILGWLPSWVGFGLIIIAGILGIIFGIAVTPSVGLVALGIAFIACAILTWVTGGTSTPQVNPGDLSFGGTLDNLKAWVWLVDFGLILVAVLIAVFVK
jgi:hypothetical protein